MGNSGVTDVQFRHYIVLLSCENISSIFVTLQAIKVGPKLEVSHDKCYFHIKGEGLGLLKGVRRTYSEKKQKLGLRVFKAKSL